MKKCRPVRYNDEMQCRCGKTWGVDEDMPDCQPVTLPVRRRTATTDPLMQSSLKQIRDSLNDAPNPTGSSFSVDRMSLLNQA